MPDQVDLSQRALAELKAAAEIESPDCLPSYAIVRKQTILALIDHIGDLREAAREVWESVPGTYDPEDPNVKRHARALNALPALLRRASNE